MKQGITNLLLISLAMVFVALPAGAQVPKPSPATSEPIKIGGSLPLTGIYSETAKWIKGGYEYWA